MSAYDEASILITPTAFKAGKLYAIKPTNGEGDMTVTRATAATRVNKDGLIESVAANVPRLDYSNGSCPSILVEPQATNLATNSDGNLGAYPTNGNVSNAVTPIAGFSNSIQFTANGVASYAYKNITTTAQLYALSVFIEMDDGGVPEIGISTLTGDFCFIISNQIANNSNTFNVESFGGSVYRISTSYLSTGLNISNGIVKYSTQSNRGFRITGVQFETGSVATSYIPTASAAVTRNFDSLLKTNIVSQLSPTEGTIYMEVPYCYSSTFSTKIIGLNDSGGTTNNFFGIYYQNLANGSISIRNRQGGVDLTNTPLVGNSNFKIAIKFSAAGVKTFVNGSVFSNSVTPYSGFGYNFDVANNGNAISRIKELMAFPTAKSDAELIALTTL